MIGVINMKYSLEKILSLAAANIMIRLLGTVLIFSLTVGMASAVSPSISTDKTDYGPNDLVAITGTGFAPGATIILTISIPDGSGTTDATEVTADSDGNFVLTYQLIDGIQDKYLVTAVDGINTVTTSFTDSGGTIIDRIFGGVKKLVNRIQGQFSLIQSLPSPDGGLNYPNQGTLNSEIPEFPTVALPVGVAIGLVFLFSSIRKKKE